MQEMNSPQIFHGEWWVPATKAYNTNVIRHNLNQMMGRRAKYTGTLTYHGDKDAILELYHYPSNFEATHYNINDVIWGKDANGHIFTLFDVVIKDQPMEDLTNTQFSVSLILVGEHVSSIKDTLFNRCEIRFPYLRNWAFQKNIIKSYAGTYVSFKTLCGKSKLLESLNKNGAYWRLWQEQSIKSNQYDLSISQITFFEIEAIKTQSIESYLNQLEEFAQFLSIALYGDQSPTEVFFFNKDNKRKSVLLFNKDTSVNPGTSSLIKFGYLKDKLPTMLNNWQSNYENISPISNYLINSLQKKNKFEVPDFLIIAQALDGYYKRFVNKKDGKDHRKYEDGIKILLQQFSDVECIQRCHIDPIVLKDSRNKYSHLYPDDEESNAVAGEDLYWLTEKCKILLTCCILNMIGLTNKEINICCNNSPIQDIIESGSFEFE